MKTRNTLNQLHQVLFAVILLAAVKLHAGPSITYISNLTQLDGGSTFADDDSWLAQAFTTGPNGDGYLLDSATLRISRTGSGNILVTIHSDNNNEPGTQVAVLSGGDPSGLANYTFTSAPGVVLAGSTKYWIRILGSGTANYHWHWGSTYTNFAGTDGWIIHTNLFPGDRSFYLSVNAWPNGPSSQYFQDFSSAAVGATNFGDGSTLFSTALGSVASVQEGTLKELQLTAAGTGDTRSAFRLPDLDSGRPVYAFSAKWNSQVYASFTSGGADGFSFNFGQLGSVDLISAAYAQESGYSNGLTFSVQTFSGNNPGFYLRFNGKTIAARPYDPQAQWGSFNSTRHFFEVDWHYLDGLSVRMDGQALFTNVFTYGFLPQPGDRFVWAARTGGESEEVRLDNIVVMTGGNLVPVPATAPYYSSDGSNPSHEAAKAFDGDGGTFWIAFNATATIGATVSSPRDVVVYALTSGADPHDPRIWSLEGSTNNGGSWSPCGAGSGYFLNRFETRAWLGNNISSFGAYRLNVTANNTGSAVALGELKLYKFAAANDAPRWTQTSTPDQSWTSIASSSDGTRLVATAEIQGTIYTSGDAGVTWAQANVTSNSWQGVVSSADGNRMAAIAGAANVYLSDDAGTNWSRSGSRVNSGIAIASSTDGASLATVHYLGEIDFSSNAGATWTTLNSPSGPWWGIASSAEGATLVATMDSGYIWRSTNSGVNWAQTGAPSNRWYRVASSGDGTRLIASTFSDGVYHSTNSGGTWKKLPLTVNEAELSCSADGRVTAVAVAGAPIYISVNYGTDWFDSGASIHSWQSVAVSGDGTRMAAVSSSGPIRTFTILPSPPSVRNAPGLVLGDEAFPQAYVNPRGLATTVFFAYGTNGNFGNTNVIAVGSSFNEVNVMGHLTGLQPATTYYYRAFATNKVPYVTAADTLAFTTPGEPPSIVTAIPTQITFGSATLNGQLNPNWVPTTAWFEWGTNTNYGNRTPLQGFGSGYVTIPIGQSISNLTSGVTYHYRAVATNSLGTNYGSDVAFTTRTVDGLFDISIVGDSITGSSPASPAGQDAAKAIDDTAATKYLNLDKLNTGFTIYPTVTNRAVQAITLISAEDAPERDPASFVLEGSMDGTTFTRIASNAVPPFPTRHYVRSISFSNSTAYPVYRVTFPTVQNAGAANSMQIAEVELLPHAEITSSNDTVSITLPPGASDVNGVGKLFDRQLDGSQKLEVAPISGGNTVVNVTLAAGAKVLKGFELIGAADDASFPERRASSVTLAGSNDGTNFTTLSTMAPDAPLANLQLQGLAVFSNTIAYARYRITFGPPVAGDRLQLGELRLFGEASVNPTLSIRAGAGNILVSWPNTAGFNLESKTNLTQLNWNAVTNSPVLSNGVNTVTIPMTGPTAFFRLRK